MIFLQIAAPNRSGAKSTAVGVAIAAQRRFRATQPLDFQALRAFLGQAPR